MARGGAVFSGCATTAGGAARVQGEAGAPGPGRRAVRPAGGCPRAQGLQRVCVSLRYLYVNYHKDLSCSRTLRLLSPLNR